MSQEQGRIGWGSNNAIQLATILRSVFFWFTVTFLAYCFVAWVTLISPNKMPATVLPALTEARSLLTNLLASFLLFYLVSFLPDKRRRRSLRIACSKMYQDSKEDVLWEILQGSYQGGRTDIDTSLEAVEQMMKPDGFRKVFAGGSNADEGIYAFSNYIQNNPAAFRSIIAKFQLMALQIQFLLNNTTIENQEKIESLKRIERWLLSMKDLQAGYNEEKTLTQAIWAIFAGWSRIEGYVGYDPIEKAIAEI